MVIHHKVLSLACLVLAPLVLAGCGGDEAAAPTEVVLVTHDSFAISKEVKAAFESESGLRLRILQAGDANETLNRALLTAGDPQGDVIFGIDSSVLSRALEGDLLEEYRPDALAAVIGTYVVPYDQRDADRPRRGVPQRRSGLVRGARRRAAAAARGPDRGPRYRDLLVVENPATSSPGLAFLLATVARFGEDGWQAYWRALRENGVLAVDGWEEAYTQQFSGAGGQPGQAPDRRLVRDEPGRGGDLRREAPRRRRPRPSRTAATARSSTPAILRGARNEDGARKLIEFMLSEAFQADVPGSMFVYPVREGVELPPAFVEHALVPESPLAPAARRDRREPRPLGRRVDRDRRALSAALAGRPSRSRSSSSSSPGRCRDSRAQPRRGDGLRDGARRAHARLDARDRVVHALAGDGLDGAHAARRPAARVGARAVPLPRPLARARRSCSCPFVLPTVVVATAFVALLPDGVERSVWAILLAHVFFNVAVVVRVVGSFWAALDPTPRRRRGDARGEPRAASRSGDAARSSRPRSRAPRRSSSSSASRRSG